MLNARIILGMLQIADHISLATWTWRARESFPNHPIGSQSTLKVVQIPVSICAMCEVQIAEDLQRQGSPMAGVLRVVDQIPKLTRTKARKFEH